MVANGHWDGVSARQRQSRLTPKGLEARALLTSAARASCALGLHSSGQLGAGQGLFSVGRCPRPFAEAWRPGGGLRRRERAEVGCGPAGGCVAPSPTHPDGLPSPRPERRFAGRRRSPAARPEFSGLILNEEWDFSFFERVP